MKNAGILKDNTKENIQYEVCWDHPLRINVYMIILVASKYFKNCIACFFCVYVCVCVLFVIFVSFCYFVLGVLVVWVWIVCLFLILISEAGTGCPQTYYVLEDELESMILLHVLPKC